MSIKLEKKTSIIEAATEEFLSKGLDAASMHHIAQRAEVSKRTLYKYYSSKDELYFALIDEILDRIESMYSFSFEQMSEMKTKKNVKEQIAKVIEDKVKLTLTDSFLNISKIIIGELLKGRSPSEKQMARFSQSESQFTKWIEQTQKNGHITSEMSAEEIASHFHSLLKGQIYWPVLMNLVRKEDIDLTKARKQILHIFLKAFCTHEV